MSIVRKLRCAVYTRKSHEEGLNQAFNSLDAQRDAGESYIAAQKAEGWVLVPDRYDDGGFTGANLDRPALKRLMADIEARLIDIVVVYKIDRLTRSLADFSRLIEVFDKHNVSFVSVTQQFSTTSSMGRLTLNILLSFAQFEREVTGERIRDKFAASKKKGIWMGGYPPLGYDVKDRKLVINEAEAKTIHEIYERFLVLKSVTHLAAELRDQGLRTKAIVTREGNIRDGVPISKGYLYRILTNPVYIGQVRYKDQTYKGEHPGIIDQDLWARVQASFGPSPRTRANTARCQTPALLKGLACCGGCSSALTPTSTRKKGKLYSYYAGHKYLGRECPSCPIARVPAAELDHIIIKQIAPALTAPEMVAQTAKEIQKHNPGITEDTVRQELAKFEQLWPELFPAEQRRVLELLIDAITVNADHVDIAFKPNSLTRLLNEAA